MNTNNVKKKKDTFMDDFTKLVEQMNKPTPVHNESGRGVVKSDDVEAMHRHLDDEKNTSSK